MSKPRAALKSAEDLVTAGLVPAEHKAALQRVAERYAVSISTPMAELIDPCDASDPIALQFVPDERELATHPAELADPIGDGAHSPLPGLVHRYPDRVLLKIASVCPVYCRFCFRREMVGPDAGHALSEEELAAALSYIRERKEIWEVILTGGDPFILSPRRIAGVSAALGAIDQVKVLRWHTRVPVVAPERITGELIGALKVPGKATYVALHANHPRELTADARAACGRIVDAGIPMVSQTVLLKGINDDAATLDALMRAFVEARVKPYYLHHGDLAPGTSHFRTTLDKGQELARDLRGRLSGLAQPTYVLDIPGGYGKVPAGAAYVSPTDHGGWAVVDQSGLRHAYSEYCENQAVG